MLKCKILDRMANKYKNNEVCIMNKGKILAVHDNDLNKFLDSIGEAKSFNKRKRKCFFCNGEVNYSNIQSIFPSNGRIHYCCINTVCYNKLLERSYVNAGD